MRKISVRSTTATH